MALPATMKAVIFDGPYKISVQDRPVPASTLSVRQLAHTGRANICTVQDAKDIVVKVKATALCGS